jgi:hypothetical protein
MTISNSISGKPYIRTYYIPVYPAQDCACHYGYTCGSDDINWSEPIGFAITNDEATFKKFEKGIEDINLHKYPQLQQ